MVVQKKKPFPSERKSTQAPVVRAPEKWPFGRKNYILFAVALVVIVIGFFFLSTGDITIAPILLVAGYCVLVPWAILARDKEKVSSATEPSASEPKVS
jgi:Ca2+/Na+ antiporter